MGTRHLICVMKDGEYRIAQYGQWDGYPSSQGVDILNFLHQYNKEKFLRNLDKYIKFGTEEQIAEQWTECGADGSGWAGRDVSDKHNKLYPENSRDTGAKILNIVEKTKKNLLLCDSISFAADSLFCEYAYVIDFDKNVFEVYEGFNSKAYDSTGRFAFLFNESEYILDRIVEGKTTYYPVVLEKTFSLDSLPTKDEFLKEFELDEE